MSEHRYAGSYKAVQRFVRAQYPRRRIRARRRVETPPGAQAQADWAEFRGVVVAGERRDLFAFHLVLSHSRCEAIVWSERTGELAWLSVHNGALTRLGGVPGVIRVDNTKTAIAWGAGPWGGPSAPRSAARPRRSPPVGVQEAVPMRRVRLLGGARDLVAGRRWVGGGTRQGRPVGARVVRARRQLSRESVMTLDEFLDAYPSVKRQQVVGLLQLAEGFVEGSARSRR